MSEAPPGHLGLALNQCQPRLAVASQRPVQGFGSIVGDLLRGKRHDDTALPLHFRPAEQLIDDLIGPRLQPCVALQHRV